MDTTQKANVEKLLSKAAIIDDPQKAINFSQAALNAANALRVLSEIDHNEKVFEATVSRAKNIGP